MLQKFCNTLQHYILFFADAWQQQLREAALFMVLEYSIRGIFDFHCQEGIQIFKLNNLCVFKVAYYSFIRVQEVYTANAQI